VAGIGATAECRPKATRKAAGTEFTLLWWLLKTPHTERQL
jgi:hypothetical protein